LGSFILLLSDWENINIMVEGQESSETKFTFEEVRSHLYKQAIKVHKRFYGRYEINELVNEVWVKGSIQELENIKYVSARAYYDMIDYIRVIEGKCMTYKGMSYRAPRAKNNMHSSTIDIGTQQLDIFYGYGSHDRDFFDRQEDTKRSYIDYVDDKDEVEYILSHLSEQHLDFIKKHFFEGLTLKEIAKQFQIAKRTAWGRRHKILKNIRMERMSIFLRAKYLREYRKRKRDSNAYLSI
jgi:hypothetical protein